MKENLVTKKLGWIENLHIYVFVQVVIIMAMVIIISILNVKLVESDLSLANIVIVLLFWWNTVKSLLFAYTKRNEKIAKRETRTSTNNWTTITCFTCHKNKPFFRDDMNAFIYFYYNHHNYYYYCFYQHLTDDDDYDCTISSAIIISTAVLSTITTLDRMVRLCSSWSLITSITTRSQVSLD